MKKFKINYFKVHNFYVLPTIKLEGEYSNIGKHIDFIIFKYCFRIIFRKELGRNKGYFLINNNGKI